MQFWESLICELPDEIRKYRMMGAFEKERKAIARWREKPVGEMMKRRLSLEETLISGIEKEFPYTIEETIALFREKIPDFEEADLQRLDEEGLAEWMIVDGKKHYIHNIIRNVFRKNYALSARTGLCNSSEEPDAEDREETRMLKEAIAVMKEQGFITKSFHLRQSIRLKDEFFTPGMHLKAHLPLPAIVSLPETDTEIVSETDAEPFRVPFIQSVRIVSADEAVKSIDPENALWRAICFEKDLTENRAFYVESEYTVRMVWKDVYAMAQEGARAETQEGARAEVQESVMTEARERARAEVQESVVTEAQEEDRNNCVRPDAGEKPDYPSAFAAYLKEQYPHILFTPYLRELAAEICQGQTEPLCKARRIYDYITKNVRYSYMRDYFYMDSIADYCARNLRGDCGVQSLLFITLCRISGIPALWQSGLYTIPTECGAHDWALFYTSQTGWAFADLSFGGSAMEDGDEERRRFYFGNLDPFRMSANHAFMQEFSDRKTFLPIDPCDNQLGEMESDRQGFDADALVREKTILRCWQP